MWTFNQAASSAHLPWVEKYRPTKFEELASHDHIFTTLTKFIESGKLPHLLFYGPPGTGKTTTILACARKLFDNHGESMSSNVLELNASDDRGIDVVREQIKTFASTKTLFKQAMASTPSTGLKLVILDEADAMTTAAQDALRRIIEKHVRHVRFCLVCNDISRITPAIQSRCTWFRFAPLSCEHISQRLSLVIETENLMVTPDGKKAVVNMADGDMRKALNILQSTASIHPVIDEDSVYQCVSLPTPSQVETMVECLLNHDFDACYLKLSSMQHDHGFSLTDLVKSVFDYLLNVSLPSTLQVYLFDQLSDLARSLALNENENVHMAAMIGIFQMARGLASVNVNRES